MSEWSRFVRFNAVAAMGLAVQLAALWLLLQLGVHYAPATTAAVAAAVAHNLAWHVSWTWRDRAPRGPRRAAALLKLAAGQGGVSLAGNLALMPVFVTALQLPPLVANILAVAACGVASFGWGRACFPQAKRPRESFSPGPETRVSLSERKRGFPFRSKTTPEVVLLVENRPVP